MKSVSQKISPIQKSACASRNLQPYRWTRRCPQNCRAVRWTQLQKLWDGHCVLLSYFLSVGFSQAQPGIANVKKRLCRWVKSLAEGGVLEAQSVVKSDAHFVECLIDGIDKQMATNNEQFKKSLRNKVRYEVRNSFQGDTIACNVRGLMCLPQRTEVVLSKLQGNRRRTGYQTWCTAQPNFRHAEPCSTPPVRSEPAAACAASI